VRATIGLLALSLASTHLRASFPTASPKPL
jgi:hypothetical protein